MKFTAHNILLNNGVKTLGEKQVLLSESSLWKSINNTLNLFFPGTREERSKLKVADLGCLEGGYSVEFARLGFDTLGIEAREESVNNCLHVKANLDLTNLNFVLDDARNLTNYGNFDIVLCYGLLYHLNDPVDFLKKVSLSTSKLLLLHTHFAPEQDERYDSPFFGKYIIAPIKKITKINFPKNYSLSRLTTNEGYKGRWYQEWKENLSKSKVEKLSWSSFNNSKSFWLCKKDLTRAIHNVGFNSVFEQFNYTGDILPDNYTHHNNRTMFVAVKH